MKGPTLRRRAAWFQTNKSTVVQQSSYVVNAAWCAVCDLGHTYTANGFPTQPEAFAAAHNHALEHLGEDMGRWAEQLPPLTDETEMQ